MRLTTNHHFFGIINVHEIGARQKLFPKVNMNPQIKVYLNRYLKRLNQNLLKF
jgi:hypothetical protein